MSDDGSRAWRPWPDLILRVTRLPGRDDIGLEMWQLTSDEGCEGVGDRWQYTAWLPPALVTETWSRLPVAAESEAPSRYADDPGPCLKSRAGLEPA